MGEILLFADLSRIVGITEVVLGAGFKEFQKEFLQNNIFAGTSENILLYAFVKKYNTSKYLHRNTFLWRYDAPHFCYHGH